MLPTIRLANGKLYYIDFERGELRNVDNPTHYVRIADVSPLLETWDGNGDVEELNLDKDSCNPPIDG